MVKESVKVPFEAELLGVSVIVESIDSTDEGRILAICRLGKRRQAISVLDLRFPRIRPEGAEWFEAYRRLVASM